jgi:hypothetical protein
VATCFLTTSPKKWSPKAAKKIVLQTNRVEKLNSTKTPKQFFVHFFNRVFGVSRRGESKNAVPGVFWPWPNPPAVFYVLKDLAYFLPGLCWASGPPTRRDFFF